MRVEAVVLREPGRPVAVETVELDAPKADEVLVRVAAAGVCHSDLLLAEGALGDGRWPIVLGHEGAGVVEAVGEGVTHVAPGDPVVFCLVPACGRCSPCRRGKPNLCERAGANGVRGTLMDGTSRLRDASGTVLQHGFMTACFAERTVVASAGVVRLGQGIPLWQAALVGCAVVTGVGAVRNVARVRIGDSVCVIGCGGVGLQVVAAARLAGAGRIVAVDRDASRLELAVRKGATAAVAAGAGATERVRAAAEGGVDHAFEVVGSPETMRLAWDVLRPGGTAVVVGLAPAGVEVSLPAIEFLSDKSIMGCYYGSGVPAVELPELARLVADRRLELADVASHFEALDGVENGFARMRRGEGVRTVILVDRALAGAPAQP